MSFIKSIKKNKKDSVVEKEKIQHQEENTTGKNLFNSWNILKRPYLSEKGGDLSRLNKYIFLIDKSANKSEVKKEIERRYGVNVKFVNIISLKGKLKHFGNRFGKLPNLKKAVITVKAGQKIETGN